MAHPADIMLSIITGTIGTCGIPGNLTLMVTIASRYKYCKPHEWLLFMLALGDFLLCLNNVSFEAIFITDSDSPQCKVAGAIDYVLGTLSFHTPPLLAYNRYLSLYDNQKYKKLFTNRNVFLMWGCILIFGVSWVLPFVVTGNLGHDDMGLCGTIVKNWLLVGSLFCACTMIGCSYVLLVYFSWKVVVKIRNHKHGAVSRSQLQTRLIQESREIIIAMLIISFIPLFAQLPAATVKLLQAFLGPFNIWVSRFLMAPFPLTAAVNAYVTMFVVKDYRKKAIGICKKFRKSTVSVIPVVG